MATITALKNPEPDRPLVAELQALAEAAGLPVVVPFDRATTAGVVVTPLEVEGEGEERASALVEWVVSPKLRERAADEHRDGTAEGPASATHAHTRATMLAALSALIAEEGYSIDTARPSSLIVRAKPGPWPSAKTAGSHGSDPLFGPLPPAAEDTSRTWTHVSQSAPSPMRGFLIDEDDQEPDGEG